MTMDPRIEFLMGDITDQAVDAIVNAANHSLLGGGGVDGAIHFAAGPALYEECLKIGGCPTGEARITKGHNLPAKFVIHTVGPVWHDGHHGEDELLAACYRNSLALARQNDLKTIAFPSISTGAYRFPMDRAALIALQTINDILQQNNTIALVRFVLFSKDAESVFQAAAPKIR